MTSAPGHETPADGPITAINVFEASGLRDARLHRAISPQAFKTAPRPCRFPS